MRRALPFLTLLALTAPAAAQDDPAARAGTPAPMLAGELGLSLADAVKMALENNLDVEVQRFAPIIAEQDSRAAWGVYDPELFADIDYRSAKDPNANVLVGTTLSINRTLGGAGGLRGILPWWGAEYDLRFEGSRFQNNSGISALSPELRSGWSAGVTAPLLRDLIWNEPWTRVKTSRLQQLSSMEQFRRDVMDVVRRVEDAYWELIATDEEVAVARKSLETATALREQTTTQFEVGVVSKVEVVEAEAGVAEREVNLIVAKNAFENQQDVLIDLILGPGLRAESSVQVRPTDRPDEYIPYEIDVGDAVQIAFQSRPELQVAQKEIERNEIQLKFAKNQRLPQLDAILSFGNRGLAGRENDNLSCQFGATRAECFCIAGVTPPCPPAQQVPAPPGTPTISSTNFGDTFDGYDAADQFTAGALFSIPIPNTRARAGVSRSQLELRRSKTEKRRLEQNIILEVRRSARDLESAQEGIEAANRRQAAASEQLRAEQIRLEYGESTPFDVLERERDMVDAESQQIRALQVYRTSVTALDRAQGTILRNRNIAIDAVRPLR